MLPKSSNCTPNEMDQRSWVGLRMSLKDSSLITGLTLQDARTFLKNLFLTRKSEIEKLYRNNGCDHETNESKDFEIMNILNLATWNVRDLAYKGTKLSYSLKGKRVNVAVITESMKELKGMDCVLLYGGVLQSMPLVVE